jgi:conjugal transfer pilus assembly protein TraE
MDIDLAHDKSQGILRQRNGLALLAGSRPRCGRQRGLCRPQRPRGRAGADPAHPLTLTSAKVSPDYLEMVTRDVAMVASTARPRA